MIYFIQGDVTKRIKIGYTDTSLEQRVKALRHASGEKLTVLVTVWGRSEERQLHERFKHLRTHSEWHTDSESLMSHIRSLKDANLTRAESGRCTRITCPNLLKHSHKYCSRDCARLCQDYTASYRQKLNTIYLQEQPFYGS